MTPLFSLNNVCFAYDGHIALRYITLDIDRGECVVFRGGNGCGKSTLMKLLNGLVFAEEGTYWFDGDEISEKALKDTRFAKQFHQRVGYVFQNSDVQLFCSNVEEEIAFGPRQMGLSEEEITQRTEDMIALLDIEHLRERAPYHLSGGEKRKVALACILSMNPEALVLDEPLAGLDRKTQEWLVQFLLQLKAAGKTLVISTHNDELAHTLADRLVDMADDHTIASVTENQ